MTIEFPDGQKNSMWALMEAIPEIVGEILPKDATKGCEVLREALERLQLVVTGGNKFVLQAQPGCRVVISKRALEFFWLFTYAHSKIYTKLFAGEMKQAGNVELEDDEELKLPREMLVWVHSNEAALGYIGFEGHFPVPNPDADPDTDEGRAYHLIRHVIRFVILHELSHVSYEIRGDAPAELIREEANCDYRALAWMQLRKPKNETDYRRTKTGAAIALLFVAAVGIESGNYDGVNHPLAYQRPIDTLNNEYGRKEHGAWAICLTILAMHCSNVGIKVPWEKMGYDEFRDAVWALQDHMDEIVSKK